MTAPAYYRAVSGEPLAFCRQFREKRTAVREANFTWAKTQGATGVMEAWGSVWGLIFDQSEPPAGWKRERKRAGNGSYVYTPNKKSEAGKLAAIELAGLEKEPSQFDFGERFGVPGSMRYNKDGSSGMASLNAVFPYNSFIGWVGNDFWVVLPDVEAEAASYIADGYECVPSTWQVPEGLILASRAQYDLAIAKAAVDAESAS